MAVETRAAVLFGATGLIGGACLDLLLADPAYDRVIAFGRRAPAKTAAKLSALQVDMADAAAMAAASPLAPGADVFCCLGTTIAKAGSQAGFRLVDHDYVLAAATFAQRIAARQFLMVTAIGANTRSPIFYNRTKGEAEASVAALGLASVAIFRPSLLLGQRGEFRWKEKLGEPFMHGLALLMHGPIKKYRPIQGTTVARAMLAAARAPRPGVTVFESDRIAALA